MPQKLRAAFRMLLYSTAAHMMELREMSRLAVISCCTARTQRRGASALLRLASGKSSQHFMAYCEARV